MTLIDYIYLWLIIRNNYMQQLQLAINNNDVIYNQLMLIRLI